MLNRRFLPLLLAVLALPLASCDGSTPSPTEVPPGELTVVRAAANAPPLEKTQVSFWARVHDGGRAEIRYLGSNGYEGDDCMEFKIPGDALQFAPDGTRYAREDSVLITITVVDPDAFNFQFSPSGIRFDPSHPAELRVSYKWANPADLAMVSHFGIWKQETTSDPWVPIGTVRDSNLKELRANIAGFTRYAMAGN